MTHKTYSGLLSTDSGGTIPAEFSIAEDHVVMRAEGVDRRWPVRDVSVTAVASPRFQLDIAGEKAVFESASPAGFMFGFIPSMREARRAARPDPEASTAAPAARHEEGLGAPRRRTHGSVQGPDVPAAGPSTTTLEPHVVIDLREDDPPAEPAPPPASKLSDAVRRFSEPPGAEPDQAVTTSQPDQPVPPAHWDGRPAPASPPKARPARPAPAAAPAGNEPEPAPRPPRTRLRQPNADAPATEMASSDQQPAVGDSRPSPRPAPATETGPAASAVQAPATPAPPPVEPAGGEGTVSPGPAERHRGIGDRVRAAAQPEPAAEAGFAGLEALRRRDHESELPSRHRAPGVWKRLRSLFRGARPDAADACDHRWEGGSQQRGLATRLCTRCGQISIDPDAPAPPNPPTRPAPPPLADATSTVNRAHSDLLRQAAARRRAFRAGKPPSS